MIKKFMHLDIPQSGIRCGNCDTTLVIPRFAENVIPCQSCNKSNDISVFRKEITRVICNDCNTVLTGKEHQLYDGLCGVCFKNSFFDVAKEDYVYYHEMGY